MSIEIIYLGKSKQKYIEEGVAEFLKRLSSFAQIKVLQLQDIKLTKNINTEIVKNKEAEIISRHLKPNSFKVFLDENGKQYSSKEFANFINSKKGFQDIQFIIGGVYGLSRKLMKEGNIIMSFSKSTFTHQMIRLFLIEQIYRAFTIINGKKYHY